MIKIVYIICKDKEESEKIGKILIEKRLAACVNIVPRIKSIYRWKGKIIEDEESILLAKTNSDRVDNLVGEVKKLHSYEVPCIEVIEVDKGNEDYFKWVREGLEN